MRLNYRYIFNCAPHTHATMQNNIFKVGSKVHLRKGSSVKII